MDFWKTKKFKVLLKTWNQKLESSGFEDAEVELENDRALRQRATNSYRQASKLERESRLEYYLFVGHLVNKTIFSSSLEQVVMVKHAEGFSIQDIIKEIKKSGISRDRKTIRYIIRRWQMKWGIRKWSLKQMRLQKQKITIR